MNAMLYLQWLRVKVGQVEAHEQFRDILEMGDQNQLELRRRIASKLTDAHGFNPYDSDSYNFNLCDSDPCDSDPYDSDSDDSDSYSLEARMKWEWPWDHEQGFQELLLVPWFQRVWILQEVANASAAINGEKLSVTHNLHIALTHLRHLENDRVLWVDAVCIDQTNHKERSHQVQRMGNVYRQATQVVVWLGHGTEDTEVFMTMMQKLQAMMERVGCPYRNWVPKFDHAWQRRWYERWVSDMIGELRNTGSSSASSDSEELGAPFTESEIESARDGLIDILNRAWFRRVWILQEVALASAIVVHCGIVSIPALYFAAGLEIIGSLFSQRDIEVRLEGHPQAVLEIMPTRRWARGSWWKGEGGRTMFSLLKHFGKNEATDRRDIIYALRGISTNSNDREFPGVDYETSESLLANDMARFMFRCKPGRFARLDSISDLVNQLDWLLAVSIAIHLKSKDKIDLSHLPNQGRVELRSDSLRILRDTGYLKKMSDILSPMTKDHIKVSREAVLEAYRTWNVLVPECIEFSSDSPITGEEILYAALQNADIGPEVIDEFWKRRSGRRYAGNCGTGVLKLLWGDTKVAASEGELHPGPEAVHPSCLAALVSRLIRSRRALRPFDLAWKSKNGETLLRFVMERGDSWLTGKLLELGADPDL
ncbi:Heterokaryon incompatibility protein 6, OR allele [Colletotrichum siamense]|nr:Heterokaryon incompatibility protein 6, OR allele [Colletotrichum siamense]